MDYCSYCGSANAQLQAPDSKLAFCHDDCYRGYHKMPTASTELYGRAGVYSGYHPDTGSAGHCANCQLKLARHTSNLIGSDIAFCGDKCSSDMKDKLTSFDIKQAHVGDFLTAARYSMVGATAQQLEHAALWAAQQGPMRVQGQIQQTLMQIPGFSPQMWQGLCMLVANTLQMVHRPVTLGSVLATTFTPAITAPGYGSVPPHIIVAEVYQLYASGQQMRVAQLIRNAFRRMITDYAAPPQLAYEAFVGGLFAPMGPGFVGVPSSGYVATAPPPVMLAAPAPIVVAPRPIIALSPRRRWDPYYGRRPLLTIGGDVGETLSSIGAALEDKPQFIELSLAAAQAAMGDLEGYRKGLERDLRDIVSAIFVLMIEPPSTRDENWIDVRKSLEESISLVALHPSLERSYLQITVKKVLDIVHKRLAVTEKKEGDWASPAEKAVARLELDINTQLQRGLDHRKKGDEYVAEYCVMIASLLRTYEAHVKHERQKVIEFFLDALDRSKSVASQSPLPSPTPLPQQLPIAGFFDSLKKFGRSARDKFQGVTQGKPYTVAGIEHPLYQIFLANHCGAQPTEALREPAVFRTVRDQMDATAVALMTGNQNAGYTTVKANEAIHAFRKEAWTQIDIIMRTKQTKGKEKGLSPKQLDKVCMSKSGAIAAGKQEQLPTTVGNELGKMVAFYYDAHSAKSKPSKKKGTYSESQQAVFTDLGALFSQLRANIGDQATNTYLGGIFAPPIPAKYVPPPQPPADEEGEASDGDASETEVPAPVALPAPTKPPPPAPVVAPPRPPPRSSSQNSSPSASPRAADLQAGAASLKPAPTPAPKATTSTEQQALKDALDKRAHLLQGKPDSDTTDENDFSASQINHRLKALHQEAKDARDLARQKKAAYLAYREQHGLV